METLKSIIQKAANDKSSLVVWLKGGEKIYGRVKSSDDAQMIIDVTGEMSEFQPYNALILLDQVSAVAWVVPRD